jgi:hypothetical protein
MIQPQKRMGVESIWDIAFDYLLRYLASDFSAFEPAVLLKCTYSTYYHNTTYYTKLFYVAVFWEEVLD